MHADGRDGAARPQSQPALGPKEVHPSDVSKQRWAQNHQNSGGTDLLHHLSDLVHNQREFVVRKGGERRGEPRVPFLGAGARGSCKLMLRVRQSIELSALRQVSRFLCQEPSAASPLRPQPLRARDIPSRCAQAHAAQETRASAEIMPSPFASISLSCFSTDSCRKAAPNFLPLAATCCNWLEQVRHAHWRGCAPKVGKKERNHRNALPPHPAIAPHLVKSPSQPVQDKGPKHGNRN